MGSHSARTLPARLRSGNTEESAIALLHRLGGTSSGGAPNRHARPIRTAGSIDPFGTLPVRMPTGATRCSGSGAAGTLLLTRPADAPEVNPVGVPRIPAPRPAADDRPSPALIDTAAWDVPADLLAAGDDADDAEGADTVTEERATDAPEMERRRRLVSFGAEAPAGLGPDDVAAIGSMRRRMQPLVAALSVTAVGASAVLTATGFTPAGHAADTATTLGNASFGAAPAGALSLALPTDAPPTPGAVSGPASVLAPEQKPVAVSEIVARVTADAQAVATKQAAAQQAATDKAAAAKAAADKAAAAAKARAAAVPTRAPGGSATASPAPAPVAADSSLGARALAFARTKLGKPYVWGAAGPNSFDCSGLVLWAFKQVGVSLPHSSATQSTLGVPVSKGDLKPGDLVFFYTPVSHVGIYIGNGQVLHASTSGQPVKITDMQYMPFHNARRITG
jgi:peptidoglycan DL-endopeptidase CwlO